MKIVRKELILNDIKEIDGKVEEEWIEQCSDQIPFVESGKYYCYGRLDGIKYGIDNNWIEDTGTDFSIIESTIEESYFDKCVRLIIRTEKLPYDIVIIFTQYGTVESHTYKYPFRYIKFEENTSEGYDDSILNDCLSVYNENSPLNMLINRQIEKHQYIYNSLKDWFYGEFNNENKGNILV